MMRTREDVQKLADEMGWVLNPKDKIVEAIVKRENIRKEKEGEYYCPCKPPAIEDNICNPCVGAKTHEVADDGHCHCNLFWSKEYLKKKEEEGKI